MEERPYRGTELFTVRVWVENIGQPPLRQLEWRGKLCRVADEGAWYFRGWPALTELLQTHAAGLTRNSEEPGGSSSGEREKKEEQTQG